MVAYQQAPMATITPFIKDHSAFDPKDIQSMSMALQDICSVLNIPSHETAAREVIAMRIIELARRGERSPTLLRDRLLKEANGGPDGIDEAQRGARWSGL
jgi:hypothetical protein